MSDLICNAKENNNHNDLGMPDIVFFLINEDFSLTRIDTDPKDISAICLTLKAPITTAADDIRKKNIFHCFSKKIRFDVSSAFER